MSGTEGRCSNPPVTVGGCGRMFYFLWVFFPAAFHDPVIRKMQDPDPFAVW